MNRRAGIIHIKFNDLVIQAKGNWTVNLGLPKREALLSSSGEVAGYKETLETPPTIKGELFIDSDTPINGLYENDNATITLTLAGQTFVLRSAWLAEGEINTEEGNMSVTFQGKGMDIIR